MSGSPTHEAKGAVARKVETAFTLLLPIFSIVFIWQATQVSEPPRNISVGPRTFPLLIGCMMLAVSAVLVWQHFRMRLSEAHATASNIEMAVVPLEEDDTKVSDWPAVWGVLGALLALFVLLEPLGFVVALALFLFGLSTFFGPQRWLLNLVTAVTFSASFYYLFTRILDIPLPNGVLKFLF
jgi:putative tricarboxylic transport membrane protein